MEHSELVTDMERVSQLSAEERLKRATQHRQQQLKRWSKYDKSLQKQKKKNRLSKDDSLLHKRKVFFDRKMILLEAAARNDLADVRELLTGGADPNVANEDGLTALHQCCIDDYIEMVSLLVDFHADVNARDTELWCPLHAAATCGHFELCKLLVENGADLLAVNADGNMPYDICEEEQTLSFIESEMARRGVTQELIEETRLCHERFLLEELKRLSADDEDVMFADRTNATTLHVAAANGFMDVARFLVDHGCDINVKDNDGWGAVHAAACWGQPMLLEYLALQGADLDAETRFGETILDLCEDPDFRKLILDLKDRVRKNSRPKVTTSLRHRGHRMTTSGRSASIRRTSFKEKSRLSWMEARDERKHLEEAVSPKPERERNDAGILSSGHLPSPIDEFPSDDDTMIVSPDPLAVNSLPRKPASPSSVPATTNGFSTTVQVADPTDHPPESPHSSTHDPIEVNGAVPPVLIGTGDSIEATLNDNADDSNKIHIRLNDDVTRINDVTLNNDVTRNNDVTHDYDVTPGTVSTIKVSDGVLSNHSEGISARVSDDWFAGDDLEECGTLAELKQRRRDRLRRQQQQSNSKQTLLQPIDYQMTPPISRNYNSPAVLEILGKEGNSRDRRCCVVM